MGLAGKPQGVDGSQVEAMVNAGQIDEVARYCESDVLNTYRVWLLYEHFRGTITTAQLEWSEAQIREFVGGRASQRILTSTRPRGSPRQIDVHQECGHGAHGGGSRVQDKSHLPRRQQLLPKALPNEENRTF
jgi:hypothetical protein